MVVRWSVERFSSSWVQPTGDSSTLMAVVAGERMSQLQQPPQRFSLMDEAREAGARGGAAHGNAEGNGLIG